eukprot:UN01996
MDFPQDISPYIGDNTPTPVTFTKISVNPPQLVSSRLFGSHHVYPIVSEPATTELVSRRYSEFEWLYNQLQSAFPGIFVPPIPPKKAFNNQDESFIEQTRRPGLQRWLNRISQIPILAESQPFQAFMGRLQTFEAAQKEISKKFSARSADVLFSTYDFYFSDILANELPASIDEDIEALTTYLKIKEKEAEQLAATSNELHTLMQKQCKAMEKMLTLVDQTNKTDEAHNQFICNNPTRKAPTFHFSLQCYSQYLNELEPSYNDYFFLNNLYEYEDLQAFLAFLADRKAFRAKQIKSQQKARAWDTTPCATEKQRTQRNADIQQDQYDTKMMSYFNKLVWFFFWPVHYLKYVEEFNTNTYNWAKSQKSFSTSCYHEFSSLQHSTENALGLPSSDDATSTPADEFFEDKSNNTSAAPEN